MSQIHQRELADSVKLRERQAEIEVISEKIRVQEQRLDGLDVNNLMRERDSLQQEMNNLMDEVLLVIHNMRIYYFLTDIITMSWIWLIDYGGLDVLNIQMILIVSSDVWRQS